MQEQIQKILQARPLRAGSLAVTIFGDTLSQQGGGAWLGSLVGVMGRFGLNTRQSRTALFRLKREGWLQSILVGRKSYLSYTDFGRRQYERAAIRIYAGQAPIWNSTWTLIMPTGLDTVVRDELRRQLGWQGFALLANGLYAHPLPNKEGLQETLAKLGVSDKIVQWNAIMGSDLDQDRLRTLVHDAWRLNDSAEQFKEFIAMFGRVLMTVERGCRGDVSDAFVIRTLLVHEYRRALLKTTELPAVLLPSDWPGHEARHIAKMIYRAVHNDAIDFSRTVLENKNGFLPVPDVEYFRRFDGLEVSDGFQTATQHV